MGVDDIQIRLERANAIYYAGEVVRGTVHLNVSGNVTCRGFFCRMQGQAQVHWHTGSGDKRTDYDGQTMFQTQRQTLFGSSLYKTAVLNEAGQDANFETVPQNGILYIPCEAHEELNMKLILRVKDYDWGKRDDLLGEVLVDVPLLVNSRNVLTFDLQRRGRREKGTLNVSAKWMDHAAIFPAQSSTGERISEIARQPYCLVLTIHSALGLRKADFIGKNDVYVEAYRPIDAMVDTDTAFPDPESSVTLPVGETIFPIAFALEADSPGSAEFTTGDKAHIRYNVFANVDMAFRSDRSRRVYFSVVSNRPVPSLKLLAPARQEAVDQVMQTCCFKCCGQVGLVSVTFATSRRSYAAGEMVNMDGTKIVSDFVEALQWRLELVQNVTLTSNSGRNMHGRQSYELARGNVAPHATLNLADMPELSSVRIPAVPASFYGGVINPPTRQRYPCLKWFYYLQFSVKHPNCCGGNVSFRSPILVAAAPPYKKAVEKAKTFGDYSSWHPTDVDVEREAVTTAVACDTTPRITGPEDGGHSVPAAGFATALHIVEQEDEGRIDNTNPPYTPMINMFDTDNGGAWSSSMAPSLTDEPDIAAPPTPTTPTTQSSVNISPLLSAMDDSLDKRRTVGEWMRNNNTHWTPVQVGTILEHVTFSLEQTAVAVEIAAGLEKLQALTCDHIVAAMRACKYEKTEVAKAMAPSAIDPVNKDSVLDELEYAFEREAVARAFRPA